MIDEVIEKIEEINTYINKKEWSKACQLMGSILGNCLSNWIFDPLFQNFIELWGEQNASWKEISWYDKVELYIYFGKNDVGEFYDWNMFYTLLKIVDEMNQSSIEVEERHYTSLRPMFDHLIKFF